MANHDFFSTKLKRICHPVYIEQSFLIRGYPYRYPPPFESVRSGPQPL